MIKINALSVERAGHKIVNNISVELPEGKIIGLLGPSGAGKTTLIRALVGRQRIDRGTVSILGSKAGSAQLRLQVAYMPQDFASYLDLTVFQNIDYFAKMTGQTKSQITEVIHEVGLESKANQLVGTLSGGEKSRVSLAIVLLGKPKILFLDEPTIGIDPVLRQQLWLLFKKLALRGTTLLVSSHVMEEASRCDFLLLMRDGEILSYGTPKELEELTGTKTVEESFLKLVGSKQ